MLRLLFLLLDENESKHRSMDFFFFFLMGDAVMIGMCRVLLGINDLHIR